VLNIGSGITSLGGPSREYWYSFSPKVINCYAEVPPTCAANTFGDYSGELHVPSESTTAYLFADYWQNFINLNNDLTDKVTLDKTEANLIQWNELQLVATVSPEGSAVKWATTDPTIATVDENGKVTGILAGECDIFCTLANNAAAYASCHVTVSYPEITLALNEQSIEFTVPGDTKTLIATITPDNTGLTPTWKSSDETVATVDANGVVTATGEGECDITATVLDKTATCHVTVNTTITISLESDKYIVAPNDILNITPMFDPVETDIKVTSSDPTIALARVIKSNNAATGLRAPVAGTQTVRVFGLKLGTATITIESVDGKATPATCIVTVETVTGIEDINVNNSGKHQRYNVLGQPVGDDYRGFVIEDGKKVLVQ
ncbi:MAG: Ig domain-containing protein, partial [Muribaculaceae bacterium]|nr:Ig domain-containing protein [Muribaculaceae bacterium]